MIAITVNPFLNIPGATTPFRIVGIACKMRSRGVHQGETEGSHFSRIQQGVPFLGLASDVSLPLLDYQAVPFDNVGC